MCGGGGHISTDELMSALVVTQKFEFVFDEAMYKKNPLKKHKNVNMNIQA